MGHEIFAGHPTGGGALGTPLIDPIDIVASLGTSMVFSAGASAGEALTEAAANTVSEAAMEGEGTTIIGEGMARVRTTASNIPGAKILNDMPKFTGTADQMTSQMMNYNRKWILEQMRSGRQILDIGLDPARPGAKGPSIFYQMEQNMLKNYQKLYPGSLKIMKP